MPRIWVLEVPTSVLGGQYLPVWQFIEAFCCCLFQPVRWVSLVRNIQAGKRCLIVIASTYLEQFYSYPSISLWINIIVVSFFK